LVGLVERRRRGPCVPARNERRKKLAIGRRCLNLDLDLGLDLGHHHAHPLPFSPLSPSFT
jgi:hypothetical protein